MFKQDKNTDKIVVLGKEFNSEEERRQYFRDELRKHLPELKKMEGFPIGEDEDIINLSDPPYYTACPNPWLNDFIAEWEEEKKQLEKEGKRSADFIVDEPFASDISEGKNNPIYNAHSYHTKVPHPAIMRYILHYTQPGDIIFDGFAGTGMTGVAASLCGNPDKIFKYNLEKENKLIKWGERKAICGDLSSIASFISYNYNTPIDTEKLKQKSESIFKEIRVDFGWCFETFHIDRKTKAEINFVIWSDVMQCPSCDSEIVLWDTIYDKENDKVLSEVICHNCNSKFKKNELERVWQTVFDVDINKTIRVAKVVPVEINYSINNKRHTKKVDQEDIDLINKINDFKSNLWFPKGRMIDGGESRRNDRSGIIYEHQFHTKRNLLGLASYWDKSGTIENYRISSALRLAASAANPNFSKMRRFRAGKKGGGPLSGTLYISSLTTPQNALLSIERNIDFLVKALVLIPQKQKSNVNNYTGSATQVNIKDNSIDYIFTDPPFGGNIMYSELNSLWEGWLKVRTNNNKEAIESKHQKKSTFDYQNIMSACFKEYFRVLKPGKWMTVEFSNTSAAVWNGIQTSIQSSGFVISNISALDKIQSSFKAVNTVTAVKQDLVISCYKPSSEFDEKFKQHQNTNVAVWDFVEEHLNHLPIHLAKENATTAIIERSPKILFDRLIAFYVQKGLPVPIDAGKFQQGLRERFIERDGMFFTNEQVQQYDKKKAEAPNFIQLSLLVSSEQDGVFWLKNLLKEKPLNYQDIQPLWMQALAGVRKGDIIPELATILDENFLKDDSGKWYLPNPENEADLEKLRNKRLVKQFESYKAEAFKPKGKIKEVRVEALRAGFKQCYQDKDFQTIVRVGDRIPNNLLMEDEVLLQFYDIASSRV